MKRRIVLALCVSVGIGLALMMPEVQVHSSDKEQRFPLLKVEQLNDQQRPFADEILKVSSIGISGPYNMMLRSPVMGQRMFAMLDYLRFNTSVPKRLNEFAILIQARLWTSQVEWTAHYPLALKAGLPQAVADDLKVGKRPASMQPDEAAVYDLCMDLATRSRGQRRHIQKGAHGFQRSANRRSDYGERRLHHLGHVEQHGRGCNSGRQDAASSASPSALNFKWRTLQPAGFGPRKSEPAQAEALRHSFPIQLLQIRLIRRRRHHRRSQNIIVIALHHLP